MNEQPPDGVAPAGTELIGMNIGKALSPRLDLSDGWVSGGGGAPVLPSPTPAPVPRVSEAGVLTYLWLVHIFAVVGVIASVVWIVKAAS